MMKYAKIFTIIFVLACFLSACATGNHLRPDVYHSDQINNIQEVEIVHIIMISPAKVAVDNREQKLNSQKAGGLLGALVGGLIGRVHGGALVGASIGGVAGTVTGSLVPDEILVDGVSITYQKSGQDTVLNTVQVGNPCEYKEGRALLLVTNENTICIQPNNIER